MTVHLLGGGLILLTAVYALLVEQRRRREQLRLLWALREALDHMEAAIRWQKKPLPALFHELAQREDCGAFFAALEAGLESSTPLGVLWHSAFCHLQDSEAADILCRLELSGDSERVCAALALAREELTALCRRRREDERQRGRVTGAAVLSGAGLVIILLL